MQKSKKTICIVAIISIIIILVLMQKSTSGTEKYDDITIINLWNKTVKEKEKEEYVFEIKNATSQFKNVNLMQNVDENTLVNEKIAPGTEGEFAIVLKTNKNTNIEYKIEIEAENEKPEYLSFCIPGEKEEYFDIKELNKRLKGNMKSESIKNIPIKWQWKYEGEQKNQDESDTKAATKLEEFNFKIKVNVEENK